MTPLELKKLLIASGFEVYRTMGNDVVLADRVRDNLVLDSGVRCRLRPGDAAIPLEVRVIMALRRSEHPDHSEEDIFAKVRELAAPVLHEGFGEVEFAPRQVSDPGDSSRTLETFCEVIFSRTSTDVSEAIESLKVALTVVKTAESRH
ncbi:MAG: hypothetical protein KBF88_14175 [Polyangiaceae bacterium]|nr:hypothetical protein [Polyangiaceae bacterium]